MPSETLEKQHFRQILLLAAAAPPPIPGAAAARKKQLPAVKHPAPEGRPGPKTEPKNCLTCLLKP